MNPIRYQAAQIHDRFAMLTVCACSKQTVSFNFWGNIYLREFYLESELLQAHRQTWSWLVSCSRFSNYSKLCCWTCDISAGYLYSADVHSVVRERG